MTTFRTDKFSRVMLLGASGMLGHAYRDLLQENFEVGLYDIKDHKNLDISDISQLTAEIEEFKPCVIINAAAYTDVDGAEENDALNRKVNTDGPANIAKANFRNRDKNSFRSALIMFSEEIQTNHSGKVIKSLQ